MVTKYNETIYHQQKINGRWQTIDRDDMGSNYTYDNVALATCHDTMKFFRRMGSKQQVRTGVTSDGKDIIKIFSYSPCDKNYRNVLVFLEI